MFINFANLALNKLGKIIFKCNICGATTLTEITQIDRETKSCRSCESTVRMRHVIYALQQRLFELGKIESQTIPNKQLRGIGLSDWVGYASYLDKLYSYTNTFFHTEPMLDITQPSPKFVEQQDFLISSDVFEHVTTPVQRAFNGAYQCLKKNGVFVLTVPYTFNDATVEHFPNLHDFRIIDRGNGDFFLENTKVDGNKETFENLCFHGGPGTTLEMRVFCKNDIIDHLKKAGFKNIKVHDADIANNGIIVKEKWSLPITAIK